MGNPREALSFTFTAVGTNLDPVRRAGAIAHALVRTPGAIQELAASNCEVGSMVARRLDLPEPIQMALNQVYERWDGKGWPNKLAGERLSLVVRVTMVADAAVAVADASDTSTACSVVGQRAGGMFDPEICATFETCGHDVLGSLEGADVWESVLESEPEPRRTVGETRLDTVSRAFADMADLKTTFTRSHSTEVARLCEAAATTAGLGQTEAADLKRAALLHDLGRVGVPNGVWDKPSRLSSIDWERVRLHPYYTERILSRSPALAHLAPVAGAHHERQDGSGYHKQLSRSAIPMSARILAAADVYQAVTSHRPYRPAQAKPAAAKLLEDEARAGRLDPEAVSSVLAVEGHRSTTRAAWPDGLTSREIEVLRLITTGASQKEVGTALMISHRTAAHHIQHIYDKIGVSTRAAAAMYAMEHDLLT